MGEEAKSDSAILRELFASNTRLWQRGLLFISGTTRLARPALFATVVSPFVDSTVPLLISFLFIPPSSSGHFLAFLSLFFFYGYSFLLVKSTEFRSAPRQRWLRSIGSIRQIDSIRLPTTRFGPALERSFGVTGN